MKSCNGVAAATSRPSRVTAPFHASSSVGFCSTISLCKDVVLAAIGHMTARDLKLNVLYYDVEQNYHDVRPRK